MTNKEYIFLSVVVGTMLFLAFDIGGDHKQSPEVAKYNEEQSNAYYMTKKFVESSLKAPSTAKFPSLRDCQSVSQRQDGTWDISCYVDAQNSFGAMLRTHYEITLRNKGDNKWQQVSLTIR